MTEDEMVGCHHKLNGLEFEQAPGVGDGQGSLVCGSPWGRRVRHDWAAEMTEFNLQIFGKFQDIYTLPNILLVMYNILFTKYLLI